MRLRKISAPVSLVTLALLIGLFPAPGSAKEYVNEDLGFSITYPDNFIEKKNLKPPTVLWANPASNLPALLVSIRDDATAKEALTNVFADVPEDLEIYDGEEVTLADGSKAMEFGVSFLFQGQYEIEEIAVVARQRDKWIVIRASTIAQYMEVMEEKMREMAYSLKRK